MTREELEQKQQEINQDFNNMLNELEILIDKYDNGKEYSKEARECVKGYYPQATDDDITDMISLGIARYRFYGLLGIVTETVANYYPELFENEDSEEVEDID